MNPSPDHSNWVTVGEVINLVKRTVAAYADDIVKTFHAKLYVKIVNHLCSIRGSVMKMLSGTTTGLKKPVKC